MVCSGFKPRAAEWRAQMIPLSYSANSYFYHFCQPPHSDQSIKKLCLCESRNLLLLLLQINLAQSMNLKEFHLDGHKTQLGLQTGFFFISRINDTFSSSKSKVK